MAWAASPRSERLPPRHVLEAMHPEAFLSVAELRRLAAACAHTGLLPIVSVSHDWETASHPDPNADRLVSIAAALQRRQRSHAAAASLGIDDPPLPLELGVYLPWCSLCQEEGRGAGTLRAARLFLGACDDAALVHPQRNLRAARPSTRDTASPNWGEGAITSTATLGAMASLHRATSAIGSVLSSSLASSSSSLSASGGGDASALLPAPKWLAPHAMWGLGGGMPLLERTTLLLLGKRRHSTGLHRWPQLMEAQLGGGAGAGGESNEEGGGGGYSSPSSAWSVNMLCFASSRQAEQSVRLLKQEGRPTARVLASSSRARSGGGGGVVAVAVVVVVVCVCVCVRCVCVCGGVVVAVVVAAAPFRDAAAREGGKSMGSGRQ